MHFTDCPLYSVLSHRAERPTTTESSNKKEAAPTLARERPDYILLVLGVVFVLLPLGFVVAFTQHFSEAQLYLRLVASLGGALIGAWIPGFLRIQLPGVRAGGALAVLILFWQFNPPQVLKDVIEPSRTELACAFVSIKALGWAHGHKTNFCISNGYEGGNFNIGSYANGGICMTGPEPSVCQSKVNGSLGQDYECRTDGIRTECFRRVRSTSRSRLRAHLQHLGERTNQRLHLTGFAGR